MCLVQVRVPDHVSCRVPAHESIIPSCNYAKFAGFADENFFFLSAPFWQMKMTKRQVCHNRPFLCQDGFAALFVAETGQQLVQMDEALKFRDEVDT